jgi:cyclic pyranopterin phosphate synthase
VSLPKFSHLAPGGEARMVDVSEKTPTARTAQASCEITMSPITLAYLKSGESKKGDAFTVAKVAGMGAVKRTGELIPMCHPIPIEYISVNFRDLPGGCGVRIETEVKTNSKTGVEMEALTGAVVAALTIYDMAKSEEPSMVITGARLMAKTGGKSDYHLENGHPHRV